VNDPKVLGEYQPLMQKNRAEIEISLDDHQPEHKVFMIEKKDGAKIGYIGYARYGTFFEIGYAVIPKERGNGYGIESIKIMVDYLFLAEETGRIQAVTDVRNAVSQKALENAGFKKEGIMRSFGFVRGEWVDACLYSIIRKEWNEPEILTKTT
jgi:RimJ/RimL family protein N-acetyltransferase